MKTEPILINPDELQNFISSNNLCIVKAGVDESVNFNGTLNNQLNQFYKAALTLGFVNTGNLNYNNEFLQSLIGERMVNLGLEKSEIMLPGYYLFKDSRLIAYHPGTYDISRLNPDVQKATLWFGIAMGFLSSIATKSFAAGLLTFSTVMDASTGMNIFKFFKEVLESKNDLDIRRKQKTIFLNEIDKAYALLRVSKTATDEDVKKAWKNMMKEFHPDKSKDEKEKRTRLCVSINEAYEIIMNHRRSKKNAFNFS